MPHFPPLYSAKPAEALASIATAALRRLATVAFVLFLAAPAQAGTIGFRTDAEVKAGPGIDAKVTMTHTGDEQADDVSVTAEVEGKTIDGEKLTSMRPGESHVWNLHLFDQIARGVYSIALRTRYADGNGYPFEVVSIANATNGVKPGPRMFGSLDVPNISAGGDGVASLVVKRPPERSGDYEAELIVPSGLEASPKRVKLEFNAEGRATASFQLKNLKLLNGTSVNMYAFVRGRHEDFPQIDAIRGTVRIAAAPTRVGPARYYETAAALFALLIVLEGFVWVTGRRRETAA